MIEIIQSPRLEDLARELVQQMQRQRRRDVRRIFEPLTLVVPHLGVARWLEQQIAEQVGICANIEFIFPGEWVQRLMSQFLPELEAEPSGALERYQINSMTWALYPVLSSWLEAQRLPAGERYTLAHRYAQVFADYQIYRPDWLQQFTRMPISEPFAQADERTRQALLWQALQSRLGAHDRSQRFMALQQAIEKHHRAIEDYSAQLNVSGQSTWFFGVAQLPPDVLTLLRCLAQHQRVQLYFPNPCLEYWADVVRERFLERRALSGDLLDPERAAKAFDHFEVGHPLLASLGAQGQAFFAELASASDQFFEVECGEVAPGRHSLLHALQAGIQTLQPNFLPDALQEHCSVQVLQCASRLDELYLVKAKIIAALNADASLRLEQIAVLAPNLSDYAALVPSVFAADRASSPNTALRYVLLDAPRADHAQGSGVLAVLDRVLQLDQQRMSAQELMHLLRLETVAMHFALTGSELDDIESLLAQAHFAFALDAKHRAQLMALETLPELPMREQEHLSLHTWLIALDRLMLGYLHGDDFSEQVNAAPAPLWPVPGIGSADAKLLAVLAQVLRQLRLALRQLQRRRSVPDWIAWLERQVLALAGRACADDEVYAPFKQLCEQLESDVQRAGLSERVEFAAVREALQTAMRQALSRTHSSAGGVCVASLIPVRSLPYRWIFIVGLNEGEFPLPQPPDNINLMFLPGARRVGDRNRVNEDRYLVLEALMASRTALVLSYLAVAADGSTRAPSGVLSELLRQLQRQFGARFPDSPWLEDHRQVRLVPPTTWQTQVVPPSAEYLAAAATLQELTPNALLTFWKNPLPRYLLQRYGLAPAVKASQDEYREPLSLDTKKIERIEWRLLKQARYTGAFPDEAPNWLARSGLLPSGVLGAQAWENVRARSLPVWQQFEREFGALCGVLPASRHVDLRLESGLRIHGWVNDCYPQARCLVYLAPKAPQGNNWLELLLRLAIVQADDPQPWRLIVVYEAHGSEPSYFNTDSARSYLMGMVQPYLSMRANAPIFDAAERERLPWFWPRLSFRAAREGKLPSAYQENFELRDSGFYQFYRSEKEFGADEPVQRRFQALAQHVFAPIVSSENGQSANFEHFGFDSELDGDGSA